MLLDIPPGGSYTYRYEIPADHPVGHPVGHAAAAPRIARAGYESVPDPDGSSAARGMREEPTLVPTNLPVPPGLGT
mgnify:CR=1 FL=1